MYRPTTRLSKRWPCWQNFEKREQWMQEETVDLTDQTEHKHDWRISPHKYYRASRIPGERQFMLRCPTCPCVAWGHEASDVKEWPKFVGIIDEIDVPTNPSVDGSNRVA